MKTRVVERLSSSVRNSFITVLSKNKYFQNSQRTEKLRRVWTNSRRMAIISSRTPIPLLCKGRIVKEIKVKSKKLLQQTASVSLIVCLSLEYRVIQQRLLRVNQFSILSTAITFYRCFWRMLPRAVDRPSVQQSS